MAYASLMSVWFHTPSCSILHNCVSAFWDIRIFILHLLWEDWHIILEKELCVFKVTQAVLLDNEYTVYRWGLRGDPGTRFTLRILIPSFYFNYISYWFQVYSSVIRQSYTSQSGPPNILIILIGTMHSYCNIIDYIPYAVLTSPWLFL